MRDVFGSIPLWTYLLLVLALVPVGAAIGTHSGWSSGSAAFALVLVPTCAAALSGNRTTALATALLATLSGSADFLGDGHGGPWATIVVASITRAVVLLTVSSLIVLVVNRMSRRVEELDVQNTKYVRELYERERQEDALRRPSGTATADIPTGTVLRDGVSRAEFSQRETVNFAMLLLTLQDIARRISTNRDLESLIPTIINTARASLKCKECQLYFWDPRRQTLSNALPPRARDQWAYVPHPQRGMARWVIENRQILTRRSVDSDYMLQSLAKEETQLPDAIAPLTSGGELLGLLIVDDVEDASLTFVRLLYVFAHSCALGVKNAQLFKRIEEMARRDGLTGLLNHASFRKELSTLFDAAHASSAPLSAIMSDVDHFKRFNDTYGHQAGDRVLEEVARLWQAVMPETAVLARYGGEEFICALPGEDVERARQLAELMREQMATHAVDFQGKTLSVTASFGVAALNATVPSAGDLVRLADEALYQAKKQGRNRVVCSRCGGSPDDNASEELVVQSAVSRSVE